MPRPPKASVNDGIVTFPLLECWNPLTKVATLAAEVNKNRVLCRISFDVLRKKYRASKDDPMRAVAENRASIRAAAKRLIENKSFEEDGSVVVKAVDLAS